MADVLIAGATGLIGGTVLNLIANDPAYPKVLAVARRPVPVQAMNIRERIVVFFMLFCGLLIVDSVQLQQS